MQHPSNDWNPDCKVQLKKKSGIQYLESGIHGVESRIYDCLGFPYMGRTDKLHTSGRPYLGTRQCHHIIPSLGCTFFPSCGSREGIKEVFLNLLSTMRTYARE